MGTNADNPFVGPDPAVNAPQGSDNPFVGAQSSADVAKASSDDPHYLSSYFAGLVKQAPAAAVGLVQHAAQMFNPLGPALDIGHYFNKNIPSEQQFEAPTQQAVSQGVTKAVKATTGFDANAVHPNSFGEKLSYNLGGATPFMAIPGGGPVGLVKNIVGGIGAVTGQTAAQEYAPGNETAQIVATILGGLAGGKIANAPEAMASLLKKTPVEDLGGKYVSDLATSSGRTPEQIEQFGNEPANVGKPVLGAEAIGRQAITGTRALALRPGTTGDTLGPMLEERAEGTGARIKGDLQQATGIDPDAALGNIQGIVSKGRQEAKPLYEKSFTSSPNVDFEDSFANENARIGKLVDQEQQNLNDANNRMTQAEAQLHRAGDNVYGVNSALQQKKIAQQAIDESTAKLSDLQDQKDQIAGRLKQAQADKAAGIRGGVWSPRIQQFLDEPLWQQASKEGLETQRIEDLRDGVPFNPKDYAIVGKDAEGNDVVGAVPNMRLLDAMKRGIDVILKRRADSNPVNPGVLPKDENTIAILGAKNAFLKELDGLNSDYGAARAKASDYLSAQDAFNRAQKMFSNPNVTSKQFNDFLDGLDSDTDRTAAKGGVANLFFNQAEKGQLNGRMFSKPILAKKLQGIVADPDKAATFLSRMNAEAQMVKSGSRMHPGLNSTTFESGEASNYQDLAGSAINVGKGLYYGAKGNVVSAGANFWQAYERLKAYGRTPGMPEAARNQAGNILMGSPAETANAIRQYRAKYGTSQLPPFQQTPLGRSLLYGGILPPNNYLQGNNK